jgi:hypothetical protein
MAPRHIPSSKSSVVTNTERPLVEPPNNKNSPERPPSPVNNCSTDSREPSGATGRGENDPRTMEGNLAGAEEPATAGDNRALKALPAASRRARRSRALRVKVGSHDENLRISLVQNFVPGYGLFYGKKAPPNNQRFLPLCPASFLFFCGRVT